MLKSGRIVVSYLLAGARGAHYGMMAYDNRPDRYCAFNTRGMRANNPFAGLTFRVDGDRIVVESR